MCERRADLRGARTLVKFASHCGHELQRICFRQRGLPLQRDREAGRHTHNAGTECCFVVRWCRLRSASRAKTLLQPLILHGHVVASGAGDVDAAEAVAAAFFFVEGDADAEGGGDRADVSFFSSCA